MFEKQKEKIDELKEDLIYAVDEHYDGELDIEDVADTEFLEMKFKQDKKAFDISNESLAEVTSLSIKMMEYYLERLSTISNRTSYRNRGLIEETFEDMSRMSKILILSIRKNNAAWQALLYENKKDDEKKGKISINDLLNGLDTEWGEE